MTQALDSMISTLRKLGGKELLGEIAKETAPILDEKIKATARGGQSPAGKPWEPRKKDGQPALQGVEAHIQTRAFGDVVRMTLTGPEVYAHTGARGPKREVIPSGGAEIPPQVSEAIEEAAGKVFARIVGAT